MNSKKLTISLPLIVAVLVIIGMWYNNHKVKKELKNLGDANKELIQELGNYRSIVSENEETIKEKDRQIEQYFEVINNLQGQIATIRNEIRNIPRTIIGGTPEQAVVVINNHLGKDAFVRANVNNIDGYFTKEYNVKPVAIAFEERNLYKELSEKLHDETVMYDSVIKAQNAKYLALNRNFVICDSLYLGKIEQIAECNNEKSFSHEFQESRKTFHARLEYS